MQTGNTKWDRLSFWAKNHWFVVILIFLVVALSCVAGIIQNVETVRNTLGFGNSEGNHPGNGIKNSGASNGVTQAAKDKEANGVTVLNTKIEEYRKRAGLRPLPKEDNDLPIAEIPRGVYGYIYPDFQFHLDDSVKCDSAGQTFFELHKSDQGQLFVIGFVSSQAAIDLGRDKSQSGTKLTLYSAPWAQAQAAVRIGLGAMERRIRTRDIELGELTAIDITLK